jgi:hypothetical protein
MKHYGGKSSLLRSRINVSVDRRKLAILCGEYYTATFHGVSSEDLAGKRVLYVYTQDHETPIFVSDSSHYVYSGPVFASDSTLLAFSTASDFSETTITLGTGEDSSDLDVATWNEHVNVLDIGTNELRRLGGETVVGYGEWSDPRHYKLESFLENDTVLFATSTSEAGTMGIWNILVDTNECFYFENPFLFANKQE